MDSFVQVWKVFFYAIKLNDTNRVLLGILCLNENVGNVESTKICLSKLLLNVSMLTSLPTNFSIQVTEGQGSQNELTTLKQSWMEKKYF